VCRQTKSNYEKSQTSKLNYGSEAGRSPLIRLLTAHSMMRHLTSFPVLRFLSSAYLWLRSRCPLFSKPAYWPARAAECHFLSHLRALCLLFLSCFSNWNRHFRPFCLFFFIFAFTDLRVALCFHIKSAQSTNRRSRALRLAFFYQTMMKPVQQIIEMPRLLHCLLFTMHRIPLRRVY
jgi:hypothetical protein